MIIFFHTFHLFRWHDIACYHPKPYMCEDSDALLEYVAATNEGIEL